MISNEPLRCAFFRLSVRSDVMNERLAPGRHELACRNKADRETIKSSPQGIEGIDTLVSTLQPARQPLSLRSIVSADAWLCQVAFGRGASFKSPQAGLLLVCCTVYGVLPLGGSIPAFPKRPFYILSWSQDPAHIDFAFH